MPANEVATPLAEMMGLSPDFVSAWAPVKTIYPLQISEDRRSVSITIENGVPVDNDGEPVKAVVLPALFGVDAYDDPLVPSGLAYLASYEAQRVLRLESPFGGRWEPADPKRARLTSGFIEAIGAVSRLNQAEIEKLPRKGQRSLNRKVRRLAATLALVTVDHPDKIYLPPESPTEQQTEALRKVAPVLGGFSLRKVRAHLDDKLDGAGERPSGDQREWEEELRKHLRWYTHEEWADIQDGIAQFDALLRGESDAEA